MASTSRGAAAPVLFFFLLLLVASEMGTAQVAEARQCVSQSHKFVGACMRKSNCHHVCQTEGFTGGECRHHGGILRKCFCTKFC